MSNDEEPRIPPPREPEQTSVFRPNFLGDPHAAGEIADPSLAEVVDALPAGSALLVVVRGPNAGSRFLLDQPVTTVGRHQESDIFLDDVTVSRRHAHFRSDGYTFVVVDVGSLNGTYVNRKLVEEARLVHGDEVQIGRFRLIFVTAPADR